MKIEQLVKKIINVCKNNDLNKIYICGNGCSGKTTLSKKIQEEAIRYGNINLISTDDFLVNTTLRKNGISKWTENEVEYTGRYTSSNYESYFWKNIYELIYKPSIMKMAFGECCFDKLPICSILSDRFCACFTKCS